MRKRIFLLSSVCLLLLFVVSTSSWAEDESKITIELSSDLMNGENIGVVACWLAYAAELSQKVETEMSDEAQELKISFEAELAARKTLVEIWKEQKAEENISNKYLTELEKVYDNNYMSEYVYTYLKRDYWEEKTDLKLAEFSKWAKSNLKGHKVVTLAYVTLNTD